MSSASTDLSDSWHHSCFLPHALSDVLRYIMKSVSKPSVVTHQLPSDHLNAVQTQPAAAHNERSAMHPREKANLHLLSNERMIIPFLHNHCGIKLPLWRKAVLYLMAKIKTKRGGGF